MSQVEDNVPFYFNGDFGTGATSNGWAAEGNIKHEVAFYQRIFSGGPVIQFASEAQIRRAYVALAAGGTIVKPLEETSVGGFSAAVKDPNGIEWNLHFAKDDGHN
ncbi:hypothetical protein [Paenibacillus sp. GCM10023250]|uniref:hypothetical protein n=1 Tax=Paenibacillus sp. GCM10023250 TaxID=3252648 RepID=UPI0036169451